MATFPRHARRRAKQDVDRRPMAADRRPSDRRQRYWPARRQFEMMRAGRDIDVPGLDELVVGRLGNRHRTFAVEPLGKGRREPRRHVLGDEDGRAIGRQPISNALSASTPPVEAPTKIIFPVERRGRARRGELGARGAARS